MSEAPHRLRPPRSTALLPALGTVSYVAPLVTLAVWRRARARTR